MKTQHKITVDKSKCIKCGLCVKDCQMRIIEIRENGAEVTMANCMMCGHCLAICPTKAIEISGFEDAPEVITEDYRINPDQFLKHMKARRSVRLFTDEDVSKEDIMKILKAGQYSPTARNLQPVTYAILRKNKKAYEEVGVVAFRRIKKVIGVFTKALEHYEIDDDFLFKKAPVVIVVKATNDVDGTIAAASMEIMAQSLGLGVFYSGIFRVVANSSFKLKKMLKVKPREKVVTALVIGHPAVKYTRTAPRESIRVTED